MGMESCFLTISFVDNNIDESIIKSYFIRRYNVKPLSRPSGKLIRRRIIEKDRFVLENRFIVDFYKKNNKLHTSFEMCLSNFDRNIIILYNIVKEMSKKYKMYVILYNEYDVDKLNVEEFKKIFLEMHGEKLSLFKKRYGNLEVDLLPEDFYIYINKKR